MSAEPITRRAHAKINVFLRVLGRRQDGFHDLESVVLPLSLHDLVTVLPVAGSEPSVTVEGVPELTGRVPMGEENLVVAAVRALSRRAGIPASFQVDIHKRIPVAAGLGGGSADAAATLLALAGHLAEGPDGHVNPSTLTAIATELGSDVPAMLAGGPTMVSGRGEVLTPVHTVTTWWVLKPFDVAVAAAEAYGWWDRDPATGPDAGVLIAALETGDLALLGGALFNDLQASVVARHPEIGEAIEAFMDVGALGAIMSGSGPTVAALASHMGHADRLAEAVGGAIVVSGPPA